MGTFFRRGHMNATINLCRLPPEPAWMAHGRTALLLSRGAIRGLFIAGGILLPVRLELLLMQGLILGSKLGNFLFKLTNALAGCLQSLIENINNLHVLLIGILTPPIFR